MQARIPTSGKYFHGVTQALRQDAQLVKFFDVKRKVEMMTGGADFLDALEKYATAEVAERNGRNFPRPRALGPRHGQILEAGQEFFTKLIDQHRHDRDFEIYPRG